MTTEACKRSLKKYYEKNKTVLIAKAKARRLADPEKYRARIRERYRTHRDEYLAYHREYRASNKERINQLCLEAYYRSKAKHSPEFLRERWRAIKRREYKNPQIRMARKLRLQVWEALRGISKAQSTFVMLGCDVSTFMRYIESKWERGMSWDNYGCGDDKWNLDHIKPCSAFDLSKTVDQMVCFHYSNFRPCWHIENISKGSLWNGVRHRYTKKEKQP